MARRASAIWRASRRHQIANKFHIIYIIYICRAHRRNDDDGYAQHIITPHDNASAFKQTPAALSR